ncbi:MAG TPA: hypothetical protein DER07_03520, partial [Armatimonadetes bacterium]|nr:hypothetical protein [Armatimonadota bacterium]
MREAPFPALSKQPPHAPAADRPQSGILRTQPPEPRSELLEKARSPDPPRDLAQRRLAEYSETLERQLSSQGILGELVGTSPQMQEIFSIIRQVAPTSATVLITGESGTG